MATEVEWVEFKEAKTSFDLEALGRFFSSLANEANLKLQSEGWLKRQSSAICGREKGAISPSSRPAATVLRASLNRGSQDFRGVT